MTLQNVHQNDTTSCLIRKNTHCATRRKPVICRQREQSGSVCGRTRREHQQGCTRSIREGQGQVQGAGVNHLRLG